MKTMQLSDFNLEDCDDEIVAQNTIWGQETPIIVIMDEDSDEDDIARLMPKINELIKWVEENKQLVLDHLIEDEYLESVGKEVEAKKENPKKNNNFKVSVEDVSLPLTREGLDKLTYLDHVAIYFRDGEGCDFDDFEASEEEPVISICCLNATYYEIVYTIYHDKTFHCEGCR